MKRSTVEIMVGVFIIFGAIALLLLAFKVSGLNFFSGHQSYTLTASFQNIGDLKVRAPVTLAGVKIGEVSTINLDSTTFEAVVSMTINNSFNKIPIANCAASIYTAGLLGANYISITPGAGDVFLKTGDIITNTQPAIVLEQMIGQLLFKMKSDNN